MGNLARKTSQKTDMDIVSRLRIMNRKVGILSAIVSGFIVVYPDSLLVIMKSVILIPLLPLAVLVFVFSICVLTGKVKICNLRKMNILFLVFYTALVPFTGLLAYIDIAGTLIYMIDYADIKMSTLAPIIICIGYMICYIRGFVDCCKNFGLIKKYSMVYPSLIAQPLPKQNNSQQETDRTAFSKDANSDESLPQDVNAENEKDPPTDSSPN